MSYLHMISKCVNNDDAIRLYIAVVVQLFGTTLTAVIADNTLDNQNNINPDGTAMDGKFRMCISLLHVFIYLQPFLETPGFFY